MKRTMSCKEVNLLGAIVQQLLFAPSKYDCSKVLSHFQTQTFTNCVPIIDSIQNVMECVPQHHAMSVDNTQLVRHTTLMQCKLADINFKLEKART